jgi:hypothetical protein
MLERICVLLFAAYNVMAGTTLIATPRMVEERFYVTKPDIPTPEGTRFLMHSIFSFHALLAALSLLALWRWNAPARRDLWFASCLLNVYDAASQFFYWGARTWTHADQVYVDVGAPSVIAVVMAVAFLATRDGRAKPKRV